MSTCSVCNSFLLTLRQAAGKRDDEHFEAVKAIYLEHLKTHNPPAVTPQAHVSREQVRAAFGRIGE